MIKGKKLLAFSLILMFLYCCTFNAYACSIAGAIGDYTTDGRPVIWKNRDSWGTEDCWKVYPYYYEAPNSNFISYIGITDPDSKFTYIPSNIRSSGELKASDEEDVKSTVPDIGIPGVPINSTYKTPWAGANEKGLGVVQTAAHTLSNDFQQSQGYTPDQDTSDITNGMLNHLILSRCETVEDVEQLLRDSNDGWYAENYARNTNSIIMVFDSNGSMATFEVSGSDFTRDNVTSADYGTAINNTKYYNSVHNDDKDIIGPVYYNGIDWRTNFAKVNYTRSDGFEFFTDNYETLVVNDDVTNGSLLSDGIDDREYSSSSVKRWTRVGARMDDNAHFMNGDDNDLSIDYRYFIQKYVGGYGMPYDGGYNYRESLARFIGDMPDTDGERSTGYYPNRFCTTFSVVIVGSKYSDVDDGALTTIWLAQGEPGNTIFLPLFPSIGYIPDEFDDMYEISNDARHMFYDYSDDDCTGYSSGRNMDHTIDVQALMGNYYGQSNFQHSLFNCENSMFDSYDNIMNAARNNISNNTWSVEQAITYIENYIYNVNLSYWKNSYSNLVN